MLSVIKHAIDTIFLSATQSISGPCMVCATQLAVCQISLLQQQWSQQPRDELICLHYKIYGVIQHPEYGLQVSNISNVEEIKQQVGQLWQTINTNTTFEGHDF